MNNYKLLLSFVFVFIVLLTILSGCSQTVKTTSIQQETNTEIKNQENTQTNTENKIQEESSNNLQDEINNDIIKDKEINNQEETNTIQGNSQTDKKGISLATLATHNSRSDCWIAYKGIVYDITEFLPKHPGGITKITPYCGTASEFERAFVKKHGTSQVDRLIREGINMGPLE